MLVHQVLHDAGVDVAAAGAHGQTSQGSEAHGGVDGLAAVDGGDGGTIAQVAGDQLQLLDGLAQHGGSALGDVLVRSAVEAVAADGVVLIVLVGQGVGVGHGGHGLMESGVEHGDHGGAGHQLLAGLDADDVGGVVQRSQGIALLDGSHDLVSQQDGLGKLLAAVDHAVTDSVDFLHGGDHTVLRIDQGVQNSLDGLAVGGHSHVSVLDGLLALGLVGELAVDADALAQTLGQDGLGLGIQQLILQRGTASVDNKNVHWNQSPFTYFCCHVRRNVINWTLPLWFYFTAFPQLGQPLFLKRSCVILNYFHFEALRRRTGRENRRHRRGI